jgi:hypothetical protein
MDDPFFPFTLHAEETPHYTQSEGKFRAVFNAVRPKDLSWFAYDVVIKSPTYVTFVMYDMRDNCSGGLGKYIGKCHSVVDAKLTRPFIEKQAQRRAVARRARELHAAENALIARYTLQILEDLELCRV